MNSATNGIWGHLGHFWGHFWGHVIWGHWGHLGTSMRPKMPVFAGEREVHAHEFLWPTRFTSCVDVTNVRFGDIFNEIWGHVGAFGDIWGHGRAAGEKA